MARVNRIAQAYLTVKFRLSLTPQSDLRAQVCFGPPQARGRGCQASNACSHNDRAVPNAALQNVRVISQSDAHESDDVSPCWVEGDHRHTHPVS